MSTTTPRTSGHARLALALAALLFAGAAPVQRLAQAERDAAPAVRPIAAPSRASVAPPESLPVSVRTLGPEHQALIDQVVALDAQSQREAVELFTAYQAALEREMSRGHFSLVASVIAQTPRADVRGLLVGAFAGVWARHAPAEAAHWLRGLSPRPSQCPVIMAEVVGTWAGRDSQAAAGFAASLDTSALRSAALASAVAQWAARDAAAAGEWLAAQTVSRDFDPAIVALLRHSAWDRQSAPAAMQLAETLGDADLRLEAMADIARRWLVRDAVAARRYLADSPSVLAHPGRFAAALAARRDLGDQ